MHRMSASNQATYRYLKQRLGAWADVWAKARRLVLDSQVRMIANGYENVVAAVKGDHGTYQVEFMRQDPASRAITQWTCSCPWGGFSHGRTRQWRKFEGRSCSHMLAAYWMSRSTPLDDVPENYKPNPGERGPAAPQQAQPKPPTPDELEEQQTGQPAATSPEPDQADQTQQAPAQPQDNVDVEDSFNLTRPDLPFDNRVFDRLPEEETADPGDRSFYPDDPADHVPATLDQALDTLKTQMDDTEWKELMRRLNIPGAMSGNSPLRYFPIPVFFRLQGTDEREEDWHVAAADDFDTIHGMLFPQDPSEARETPVVQLRKPLEGEFRGGKIPHPDAEPLLVTPEGYVRYRMKDLGYHPKTEQMVMPGYDAPETAQFDETRIFGTAPQGGRCEVTDADPTLKWVQIQWPTRYKHLEPHSIQAWVPARDVALIGNQRDTPAVRRNGPKDPEVPIGQEQQAASPSLPGDGWATTQP